MAEITSYPTALPKSEDYILGAQLAPVGSIDASPTKKFTVGDVASLISGSTAYNYYTALLTQTGSTVNDAPVATVLSNNLTSTLTWARTSTGIYTLTANVATFTADKTAIFLNTGSGVALISGERTSDTVLTIKTYISSTGNATDSVIANGSFEVRIYS